MQWLMEIRWEGTTTVLVEAQDELAAQNEAEQMGVKLIESGWCPNLLGIGHVVREGD